MAWEQGGWDVAYAGVKHTRLTDKPKPTPSALNPKLKAAGAVCPRRGRPRLADGLGGPIRTHVAPTEGRMHWATREEGCYALGRPMP